MSPEEIDLRRYQARMGVWKVVWGTFLVGLAGILIPGAINFYTAHFENLRKDSELRLAKQTAHQQYIKEFFDTAVNQDIELRIRFANYFASLSDEENRDLWFQYMTKLIDQRDRGRQRINEFEAKLVEIMTVSPDKIDTIKMDQIRRELDWAYSEVGYVALGRSVAVTMHEKKQKLYEETTTIIERLATLESSIEEGSSDYRRFWELYTKELIGVESRDVARVMIGIGRELKSLVSDRTHSKDELRKLSRELLALTASELANSK